MGSTRLWLPSLRSVDSQRGGRSMVLLGHCRSGRCSGLNALYFLEGSASIGMLFSPRGWIKMEKGRCRVFFA